MLSGDLRLLPRGNDVQAADCHKVATSAQPHRALGMESPTQAIIACVNSTSVVALRSAFNVYKRIWDTFKRLAGHPVMKEQLITLLAALAHLLRILDREYRNGRLTRASTTEEKISSLDRSVKSVCLLLLALIEHSVCLMTSSLL